MLTTATQVNTLDICLLSQSTNLCIVLSMSFCRLLFQTPTFLLLPLFILFFAPPNPSEITTISTRVNQSQHTSVKHTRPVLCHRVSVFISSCYDFSWSLVVWCWYHWWCCACVDEYSPMVFDFLPSSGRTQSIICSLPSSTTPPPTTDHPCGTSHLKLQLPLLSNPVVIIISHTSIKRCRPHISFLWLLFPTTSSPSLHHRLPPPLRHGYFFGPGLPSCVLCSSRVCGLSHVALLTLFVLSAAKRERPEQNARLLLAASTSPSGPPSAPPHARL